MKIQFRPRLDHFLRAATVASLLAGCTSTTFAQGAGFGGKPAAGQSPTAGVAASGASVYELEITDGLLLRDGARQKATLKAVVDLLRELHPEANFVTAAGLDKIPVADLKLRASTVEDQLEAIRIASGSQFVWRGGNSGTIDPSTGLPVSSGSKANPSLYVLDKSSAAPVTLQVEAFNISQYVDSLFPNEPRENREKLIQAQLDRIQILIRDTYVEYLSLNQNLNGPRPEPNVAPSIRFHPGANVAVIMGDPVAVAVAAKVIGALPGAQRSVASDDPGVTPGDPFRGEGGGSAGGGGLGGRGFGSRIGGAGLGGGSGSGGGIGVGVGGGAGHGSGVGGGTPSPNRN
ncbi:MAG TPA: hypothetical protein VMB21_14795 [Candidatus Limnocylindria bacterium]|nr:hypothetical protein [Candidatus Limnocylindria bacterium]